MDKGFCRFRDQLLLAIDQEKQLNQVIERELNALPDGTLAVSHDNRNYYFSNHVGGRNIGISRDPDLIYKLARKRYLQQLQREIQDDMVFAKKAENFLSKSRRAKGLTTSNLYSRTATLLNTCQQIGLDLMRITCTAEQYKWAHAKYDKCTLYPERFKYTTSSGVKVRSKSEKDIGNALEALGLPYRYEAAITVEVLWLERTADMPSQKYKTYYPDFTIMLPNGELIIWEHLGRIDLENYRAHNSEKIAALRGNGTVKFENFITTYESDVKDSVRLNRIIAARILPRFL